MLSSSRVAPILKFFPFYSMLMHGETFRSVSVASTEFGDGWYLADSNPPPIVENGIPLDFNWICRSSHKAETTHRIVIARLLPHG